MIELDVASKGINPSDYQNRSAVSEDCPVLITDSCVIRDRGKVVLIYIPDFTRDALLLEALQTITYHRTDRSQGLATNSRIFGWSPRLTHRKDFCSGTSLLDDYPLQHTIVSGFASIVEKVYAEYAPEVLREHAVQSARIRKEYHLGDSVYTSGIINKDNPLNYHFDSGNIPGTFSSMIVRKRDVDGGHLNLPDFGVRLECSDGSLVIFDGQGLLHGVTPIVKRSNDAFRYSIVYYSLKSLWNCLSPGEEVKRIRERKAKREHNRYLMLSGAPLESSIVNKQPIGGAE